ncbi:MAG: carboxymuconolactone decarboxylase family protein [Synergistaceae bacterium]|nr:carboxymuconolactone decarboxylase family protein [Synergistaceae bacterium]
MSKVLLVSITAFALAVIASLCVSCAASAAEKGFDAANPDFVKIMDFFIEKEVDERNSSMLNAKQRELIKIASLTTQQSYELLKRETAKALELGLTPIEIKEAAMQCAPYSGFPRAADALKAIDEVFAAKKIAIPLKTRATVNNDTRFAKGLDAQSAIFGDGMRERAKGGPAKMTPINYYLVTNCFGDYYTREGLDLATREMLTLVILVNLGTEPQIKAHINGNKNMGCGKDFIAAMIYECLPYMGYPRTLNALACLNDVFDKK